MPARISAIVAGLCGALVVAAAQTGARAEDAVTIGVTTVFQGAERPEPGGGLAGFNIEIIRQICTRIDRKCELREMVFRDVMPSVASGALDVGVANVLKTPERARQVLFSVPYWRSTSSFIGRTGRQLPDLTALLTEHKVCAIAAARQEMFLRSLPGAGDRSIVPQPGNQEAMQGLVDGACDFALIPTLLALPFLRSPEGAGFAFRGLPLSDYGLGGDVHMIVSPGKPDLLQEVNKALEGMIRDGAHERLTRRYFPFSIL